MFGDVVEPSIKVGSRKWYTVPLSIVVHSALIAIIVIVPLMAADALPSPPSIIAFVAATPPPPPPPPPPRRLTPKPEMEVSPTAAPVEAPSAIAPETGMENGAEEIENGAIGGIPGEVPGSIVVDLEAPPPPPPTPAPVRVGGSIKTPTQVRRVSPEYPAIAQYARVEGMVIIEAVIGPSGTVEGAKVLRSIPLLDAAALDAVKQWVYTPTLLNGVPVPVIMTVTVHFTLQ
jgi:protein TonB